MRKLFLVQKSLIFLLCCFNQKIICMDLSNVNRESDLDGIASTGMSTPTLDPEPWLSRTSIDLSEPNATAQLILKNMARTVAEQICNQYELQSKEEAQEILFKIILELATLLDIKNLQDFFNLFLNRC